MSPEQARAQPLDARSDLFSLGSVLYAMATGHPPFRGEASFEILDQVVNASARPIREFDPSIPGWFETLVDRLHHKSPEARPESATQLRQWIDACLLHLLEPTKPVPRELVQTRPQPSLRWRLAAVSVVSVAMLVGVVMGWPDPTDNASPQPTQNPDRHSASVATPNAIETEAAQAEAKGAEAKAAEAKGAESAESEATLESMILERDSSLSDVALDIDLDMIEHEITSLEQELEP
jgi:serine/threonine protein kinase